MGEKGKKRPTVHGDGNSFTEDEAISTLKSWNFAELVELQVLGGDTLIRHSLHELKIKAILLRNSEKRRSTWVALYVVPR